jgi:hypothetical protein
VLLSVALLALGGVALISGVENLHLETLPWKGASLNYWLIGLGITGLLSVILAFTGTFRYLLPLWSLYVTGMLIRGVFLSPQISFAGPDEFRQMLWLVGGSLIALLGSLTLLRRRA